MRPMNKRMATLVAATALTGLDGTFGDGAGNRHGPAGHDHGERHAHRGGGDRCAGLRERGDGRDRGPVGFRQPRRRARFRPGPRSRGGGRLPRRRHQHPRAFRLRPRRGEHRRGAAELPGERPQPGGRGDLLRAGVPRIRHGDARSRRQCLRLGRHRRRRQLRDQEGLHLPQAGRDLGGGELLRATARTTAGRRARRGRRASARPSACSAAWVYRKDWRYKDGKRRRGLQLRQRDRVGHGQGRDRSRQRPLAGTGRDHLQHRLHVRRSDHHQLRQFRLRQHDHRQVPLSLARQRLVRSRRQRLLDGYQARPDLPDRHARRRGPQLPDRHLRPQTSTTPRALPRASSRTRRRSASTAFLDYVGRHGRFRRQRRFLHAERPAQGLRRVPPAPHRLPEGWWN